MAMSNLPSMRLVSWKTELGVGVILTSMPFFANRPFSCATQTGQLKPPGKTMRFTALGGAGGGVAQPAARQRMKLSNRRCMGPPPGFSVQRFELDDGCAVVASEP